MTQQWIIAVLAGAVSSRLTIAAGVLILRYEPNVIAPPLKLDRQPAAPGDAQGPSISFTPIAPPAPGRYAIVFSPHVERDIFLLDNQTGQVWDYVTLTNVPGKPQVWQHLDRLDSERDEIDFAAKAGLEESSSTPDQSKQMTDEQANFGIMSEPEQADYIKCHGGPPGSKNWKPGPNSPFCDGADRPVVGDKHR